MFGDHAVEVAQRGEEPAGLVGARIRPGHLRLGGRRSCSGRRRQGIG
jgi:hypothetical protein